MNFLNLRKSFALFAFLISLQLSIIHPVSGRNLVNIQRVTRNDPSLRQDYHQPDNQVGDATPTTSEPFVPDSDEILTAAEQENVDSSTESPIIQDDVNPFILVADGQFANEPIPHNVEIVTPSFLDMDVGAILDESELAVKQEDPTVDHQIVAEHYYNSLTNSPTEVPENQAQLSSDEAPVDPAVFVPENLPVSTDVLDVNTPVSDESEPIQKIEDLTVNPVVFEDPISNESVAPIAENHFADPGVFFAPISDEVEPAQKLEDPSVNPLVADVPITDEAAAVAEDPSAVVASEPVPNESEPVQKLEDPFINPLVAGVPFPDEAVAPMAELPSADPVVVSAPISAEVEPAQKLEDPSVNPVVLTVPISNEFEPVQKFEDPSVNPVVVAATTSNEAAPIVEDPSADLVVISAPASEVEHAQKVEVPSVETEQVSNIALDPSTKVSTKNTELKSVAQSDPAPPSSPPVFISQVSPALPAIVAAPQPVSPPVVEKVKINSLAASPLPKVKNILKPYQTVGQPKVTQQAVKPPADSSKTTRPVSPTKPQVQYKYQSITSPSPLIAYGPPRTTTNPQSSAYGKNSFPTRPFGSSPKPRQLGFPPIASTRDNVLLEVNWAGKLGRPYRQAKFH